MAKKKYVYKIVSDWKPRPTRLGVYSGKSACIDWGTFQLRYELALETKSIPGTEGIACYPSLKTAKIAAETLLTYGKLRAILKCTFTGEVRENFEWKYFRKICTFTNRKLGLGYIRERGDVMLMYAYNGIVVDSVTPVSVVYKWEE